MSVMSEIAIDLEDWQLNDYQIFKYLIEQKIENESEATPFKFYNFFDKMLPEISSRQKRRFHMDVSTPYGDHVDLMFEDRRDYIRALYTMSKHDCYNVFFSLTPYKLKKKTNENSTIVQGFFIDIDDLDFDVLAMSEQEVIEYIKTEYNVPEALLPKFICQSGHGLHLFYNLWDPLEDKVKREQIAQSLVTFYRADFSSSLITQNIRVPGSYNAKTKPLKTNFFEANSRSAFFLHNFDFFMKTPEEIQAHRLEENKKRAEKSAATRAKNKAARLAKGQLQPSKNTDKSGKFCNNTSEASSNIPAPDPVNISGMEYYHNFSKHARRWNLLKDLHNYFLRHEGYIYGHRASFITILSNYCWYFMNIDECKEYCSQYINDDFKVEMERIVDFIYSKPLKERYTYRYEKIAAVLGFTEEDIRMSYCSFSEERRKEAKKRNKKSENEKKKAETRNKKKLIYDLVAENINLSAKELANMCGVSERTIYRIKDSLRAQIAD